jgi:hypothetical protein
LSLLNAESDAMQLRIQAAKARKGMKAAFAASPKKLDKAAMKAARKHARS